MRNLLTVGVAVGLVLLGAASASADTILLSLTDMPGSGTAVFPPFTGDSPGSGGTVYNLSFVATASTTTLSVAGYQEIGWWDAQSNSVTAGGGSNLLGAVWTFVPASSGSLTTTYSDGTPVPALAFAAVIPGLFDTYSQSLSGNIMQDCIA